jgi:hypothetical protein
LWRLPIEMNSEEKLYTLSRLSNDMWHTTWKQVNWGDSWLLVVGSQIGSLTPDPSFGNNLCFKYPNGSCEPIWDIYIPRDFQWYKELFNTMIFFPCNRPLKIWESIGTLTPKVRVHLGVWGSFLLTFLHSREHEMWILGFTLGPHLLQTLALVANLRLGLR